MHLEHVQFEGKKVSSALRKRRPLESQGRLIPAASAPPPDSFVSWVLAQAGVDAAHYQELSLQRRLPACLRAIKARGKDEARALLEQHVDLLGPMISSLLIGVTHFFRDPPVFDALRRQVLPITAQWRRPLRVWSAGCSTGAELYSVAILLSEAGLLDGSVVLGTDLRGDAIEHARGGLFDDAVMENVEGDLREKYFERHGRLWQVTKPLRERTCWRASDLVQEQPPGRWDMILCRNLAIYLSPAVAAKVWKRLAEALTPGGFLVVGKAEQPPAGSGLRALARCIYRKV